MEPCLLQEERLAGATLLVMANKQDVPGALDVREIQSVLGLQDLGSRYAAASHDVEFAFEVKQCCSSIRRLATFICFSH